MTALTVYSNPKVSIDGHQKQYQVLSRAKGALRNTTSASSIWTKHLRKLRTADGQVRKRFLYVAIDRCSRCVFLKVYDAENATKATDFLAKARKAFPFRVTHILTDRGSCFTADEFERACSDLQIPHRKTKPYTPKTNGMVERFNGRVASEVFGINIAGHVDLEVLLTSFNRAYNR